MDALTIQLRGEKDSLLAREKEIKALRLKVRSQEEVQELAATETTSLRERLEDKEEDICELRHAAEVFDADKAMAVNGARIVARWELMRDWLNHQTDSWEPSVALEQYKMVKTTEAELLGLPTPCFDDEPQVPEKDSLPKPSSDDPPSS
ncbi:hypothetical protein F2Q69_00035273 [Brassica cretica]|uniref:Uncharacterized protein n=1 Tax=Brassica cretica TaxID=69181 RepID=A0A8S9SHT7_BRACR|nr:hypothetical protein F2Q69_00035273 [Brassica cretica]